MEHASAVQPTVPPITGSNKPTLLIALGAVLTIIAGTITGYYISKTPFSNNQTAVSDTSQNTSSSSEKIVGSNDTKTFSDTATGQLEKGGIKGEGTHHLVRPGGDSQTVYLISSVVDLDQFVGQQIEVNGQTLKGRYAGWLMDVGRVKVLE